MNGAETRDPAVLSEKSVADYILRESAMAGGAPYGTMTHDLLGEEPTTAGEERLRRTLSSLTDCGYLVTSSQRVYSVAEGVDSSQLKLNGVEMEALAFIGDHTERKGGIPHQGVLDHFNMRVPFMDVYGALESLKRRKLLRADVHDVWEVKRVMPSGELSG